MRGTDAASAAGRTCVRLCGITHITSVRM